MIQNRTPAEDYPQQARSRSDDYGSKQGYASKACSQFREYAEENPTTAVLLGFGAGLGIGIGLACLMRESISHFGHDDSFVERISNRVRESVQDIVPTSWKKRMHG